LRHYTSVCLFRDAGDDYQYNDHIELQQLDGVAQVNIQMCLAISTNFTVTTLPLQIDLYVLAVASSYQTTAINLLIYCRTLAMLNACISPIICGLMWRPFRTALKQVRYMIRIIV
jgi:hypothetical protein